MKSPTHRIVAILVGGLSVLAAAAAPAGQLGVNNAAAKDGAFGLQVTPGSTCAGPTHLEVDEASIAGDRTGCSTITVKQGEVAGTSVFTAGDAIVIESLSVAPGAELTARLDQAQSPFAWVGTNTPSAEKSYIARFKMNLDMAMIGASDRFAVLEGTDAAGRIWAEVRLKRNQALAENRMVLAARRDDGSVAETPFGEEILVPAGWNEVEMRWNAAAGTGSLLVRLNGGAAVGLTGLANAAGSIDDARLGAVSGEPTMTSGSFYLDSFESFRTLAP